MTVVWSILIGIVVFGVIVWICLRRVCPPPSKATALIKEFGPGRPEKDERFMKRFQPDASQSRADLSWIVGSDKLSLRAEVLDLSDDGARIKSKIPLDPEMPLLIQLPHMRLAGTAKVCYCQKTSKAYNVGLAFKGPLFRMPC